MILEIAHPNEAIQNQWTKADEFDDHFIDHLSSPSFDVYHGLCVRAKEQSTTKVIYTGIYNDSECVDVGFHSDVMARNSFDLTMNSRGFATGKSWIECWSTMPYPDALIYSIDRAINQQRLVSVMIQCVEEALSFVRELQSAKTLLVALRAWTQGARNEAIIDELVADIDILLSAENISQFAYQEQHILIALFQFGKYITTNRSYVSRMFLALIWAGIPNAVYDSTARYDRRRRKIADDIRRLIPFHEIAEKLV